MGVTKKTKAAAKPAPKRSPAPRKAQIAPGAGKKPKPRRKAQKFVVKEIRQHVEDRLAKDVEKASLSDYIRLVQLEKELTQTVAKETKATWVEPKDNGEVEESKSER
jgi:hypothetical protein